MGQSGRGGVRVVGRAGRRPPRRARGRPRRTGGRRPGARRPPLAEDLGQRPRLDRVAEVVAGLDRDDAIEAGDRLGVPAQPGRAEGVVVPGRAVAGVVVGQGGEGLGGLGQVVEVATSQAFVPVGSPRGVARCPEAMDGPRVGGQVGRAGQEGERLPCRGVLGIETQCALPRRPGGQGALESEVVPPLVDAGECFVVRGRGRHGVPWARPGLGQRPGMIRRGFSSPEEEGAGLRAGGPDRPAAARLAAGGPHLAPGRRDAQPAGCRRDAGAVLGEQGLERPAVDQEVVGTVGVGGHRDQAQVEQGPQDHLIGHGVVAIPLHDHGEVGHPDLGVLRLHPEPDLEHVPDRGVPGPARRRVGLPPPTDPVEGRGRSRRARPPARPGRSRSRAARCPPARPRRGDRPGPGRCARISDIIERRARASQRSAPVTIAARASVPPAIVALCGAPGHKAWDAAPVPKRSAPPGWPGNVGGRRCARSPGTPSMAPVQDEGQSAGSTGPPQCHGRSLRVPQA